MGLSKYYKHNNERQVHILPAFLTNGGRRDVATLSLGDRDAFYSHLYEYLSCGDSAMVCQGDNRILHAFLMKG